MSPRKLSDSDRQEILSLYRNSNETTSTLAMRFGVSSSTVSRFLKNSLTEAEYEDLIQEKRLARITKNEEDNKNTSKNTSSENNKGEKESSVIVDSLQEQLNLDFEGKEEILSAKKQEMEKDNFLAREDQEMSSFEGQQEFADNNDLEKNTTDTDAVIEEEEVLESVQVLAAMYGEDMGEDIDDDIDDDDLGDDDDDIENKLIISPPTENRLEVLPFESATFPRVCYLVIDRYGELVTKPLKDFGHLGNIPDSEYLQLTLPVFDNHKVAKRYCDTKGTLRSRKGKVIKVPDGKLLQKTSSYLKAKGISRILMDGKIYALT